MADEAVKIRVIGLEPEQEITIIASMHDGVDQKWKSHVVFLADHDGSVDVSLQAPITGTYTTVDPMGLFWSMLPQAHGSDVPYFAHLETQFALTNLIAESGSEEIATAHIRRTIRAADVTHTNVFDNGLVGKLYLPNASKPLPALIILGGSEGGMGGTQEAALLASHGYAVLALAYFGIPPLPSSLTEIPLEYFQAGIAWLQAHKNIDAEKIGVIGTSRGGELALLLGTKYPEIKTVVSYVGSGIVFGNHSYENAGEKSAWTYLSKPIPWINPAHDNAAEASIPVEEINGAVLLISGKDDQVWPSTLLSEVVITRLQESSHPYPFFHLAYDDAGHMIGVPFWPTSGNAAVHPVSGIQYAGGGTPAGNAFASADSWAKMLAFLETNLKNCSH